MNMRKNLSMVLAVMALVLLGTPGLAGDRPEAVYGEGTNQFSLATGSPGELGLLKVLAEAFGKQDNAKMAWFKAGSGESLKLLKDKKVDMIMVHAPAAEK
jgi:tungstate transport system substrate-binding protein